MRPVESLVHSRARVKPRYALLPLEGFPSSRLPSFNLPSQIRVLASPQLGANFVQYRIDMPEGCLGYFSADPEIETFYYVLTGAGICSDDEPVHELIAGSFGVVPPGQKIEFVANASISLIVVRKRYEPYNRFSIGKNASERIQREPVFQSLHSHESSVKQDVWGDNPNSLLQTLIPDELQFDMAMNIFTFQPGYGLPIVETHVMEHGLYFLQGKGLYYLDGEWIEVEKDDFIWMGPFCPQSFYATGPTPSRYLYYKNVNREISL